MSTAKILPGTASKAMIKVKEDGLFTKIKKDFAMNKYLVWMTLPVIAWYILFHYAPMYGVIIAFQDYNPARGMLASKWVGAKHFIDFFGGYYFFRVIRNTLLLSFYQLLFGFPAPILLAVMLNELKSKIYKKAVQTITYIPHFVSMIVICGMIVEFTAQKGIINDIVAMFGGERTSYLLKPEWFRFIYVGSGIWREIGWGSIIYLAALAGIDQEQYEAARIDGAGRWRQFLHVTLPGIAPTIVILLILNIGRLMSEGFEKVILLYNPGTYETADIISSYVYRRGLVESNYSFSTAVGLFNSVVNCILLVTSNWISRKVNETSLW